MRWSLLLILLLPLALANPLDNPGVHVAHPGIEKTGPTLTHCHICDNSPGTGMQLADYHHASYEPSCGKDNFTGIVINDSGFKANSIGPSGDPEFYGSFLSCYTNVYYDGSHRVIRGGTATTEEDGACHDSGFSITCFCKSRWCNEDLCQHCTRTKAAPPSQPDISPAPAEPLQCYSCINCNTVNGYTNVKSSEKFRSCFVAIEIGSAHFVIRGGSPDYHEDGTCLHESDGAIICYCTSNHCNREAAAAAVAETPCKPSGVVLTSIRG